LLKAIGDRLKAGEFSMDVAIVTFEGFNEIDSFLAFSILNRVKQPLWNVQITSPTAQVTSMNGVTIQSQQPLAFANQADVVLFGSGIHTRRLSEDKSLLSTFALDPNRQLIGSQCSGALILAKLGLLNGQAATDLTTKPYLEATGTAVCDQPFWAEGNLATAGGCLSSQYLAGWVISKCWGDFIRDQAIAYVAPVGEKETYMSHIAQVLKPFLREDKTSLAVSRS
jgi:transcriptional regulator GlxA family with amidase domain